MGILIANARRGMVCCEPALRVNARKLLQNMRIASCIVTQHNFWLVLLAAIMCLAGTWISLRLFARANSTSGLQMAGWAFLTAIAAGSSIWSTHFIAMLAYDPQAPFTFDPMLTMLSLVIAIAGTGLGFAAASSRRGRFAPEIGGSVVGMAIAAMHYTGMMAYHVDGLVQWDRGYVAVSIAISIIFAVLAVGRASRGTASIDKYLAVGLLALAIVGLHFTGMAAVWVLPMRLGVAGTEPAVLQTMAIAVASASLLVIGTGVASYLIDGRTRAEALQRFDYLALNDALTGLPNRRNFNDYLNHELGRAAEGDFRIAVVGIDLDRFGEINDLRGHAAGDQALKIIGRRLSILLQDGEFIARVGGDEFTAIKRFLNQNDLLDFAARLERTLFQPIPIDDLEAKTGASIGIAVFPDDGRDRDSLVSNADLAMRRAKADVTRAICFYESKMDETARARRTLADDLRKATEQGELDLHYQVQVSIRTGNICGYEALLRWSHPKRGPIPPSEFIPIAEESGAIIAIGEWVLRKACQEAASWDQPYKIAVNLSPVQFAHADLAKLVHEILLETGLPANRLELELTESTIIADKNRNIHTLRQIKALGVTIAIDDFGTGYSSLDTLRSFPFDKIKLDQSFMSEVERSPQAKAIVRAVLALGKSFDIRVLAEGVETDCQLSILREERCDEAQGYLFGRPQPIDQIFRTPIQADDWSGPLLADRRQPTLLTV